MSYMQVKSSATIEVPDHKGLLAAWKLYGPGPLVGRFIVNEPLTKAQLRRLPSGLRELLN